VPARHWLAEWLRTGEVPAGVAPSGWREDSDPPAVNARRGHVSVPAQQWLAEWLRMGRASYRPA